MFDDRSRTSDVPDGTAVEALSAQSIAAFGAALCAGGATGLDDAARVDAIRALEELVCVATAAQARLARELHASQRRVQAEAGVPAARRGGGVAAQVALARRESPHRGRQHLGLALIAPTELPCTWEAWRTGRISEWRVSLIARETACLPVEHRLEVDRIVAGDPDRLERMGDAETTKACLGEAARLDAAAVTARRRRAESERRVTVRPAPDTMAYVTALVPVKDGVAVHAVLTRAAASARAAGDPRSAGQVMADALVGSVLGRAHQTGMSDERRGAHAGSVAPDDGDDDTSRPVAGHTTTEPSGPRIELGLVMSHEALFGISDEPAHIDGYGPIPAELAREIVAGACDRNEEVWLRRLYTSPRTGELVTMDARTRLFRHSLNRFIRLRDQVCRTPWCDAPIRHLDHSTAHVRGGPTSGRNGQGLCEACSHAKEATGWRAGPGPDGSIHTTTPSGHTYGTRPPALVTIRRSHAPPLSVDYVLTG